MEAAGKRYILYPSRSDEFTIYNLSDLHLMSRACAEDRLSADIEKIRLDPYAFWFGGGDYCEYIGYHDKRFDPDSVDEGVTVRDLGRLGKAATEKAIKLLKPIAAKCLGLLNGNHEKLYQRHQEQGHLHSWMCVELGAANLEYSAFVKLVFWRWSHIKTPRFIGMDCPSVQPQDIQEFVFFLHHGAGFAQTPGGKLNRLQQFMDSFEADVYMVGHVHDRMGKRIPILAVDKDCKRLMARDRVGIISGSYLRTYSQGATTYAEERGYRPVAFGPSFVKIRPMTREIRGEI